jgi:hypothetical protein
MFATSAAERSGILVAVITGGRPLLKQRIVERYLPELERAGVSECVWVLNERDVETYEEDYHAQVTYPDDWAYDYARTHWMNPSEPPKRGGFYGAFPGREWACREAEKRGCWAVLQLDDNINRLTFVKDGRGGIPVARDLGGLEFFVDVLAGVALSTNARTVGAQLCSVPEAEFRVARPGFPYSLFIEKVGEGREPWHGPYEDDITHSLQYGDRADGATAAVMPLIRYDKESLSKTGMRVVYNHTRSKQLQALYPQAARVGVRATKSNGQGGARVFHTMPPGAIRNPLRVVDRELYARVQSRLLDALELWKVAEREGNKAKARERAERYAARQATTD